MVRTADVRALRVSCWQGALMGAWGSGPFENDDAADFAGDLSETTDTESVLVLLVDAMTAVTDAEGYVDAPEMNCALAASALVAMFVNAVLPMPPSLGQAWLEAVGVAPPEQLKSLAQQVITRAQEPADNEWYELWAEAELLDEVGAHLAPYSSALV